MAHFHAVGDFSSYQESLYESLLALFVSSFSKASRMKNKKKYHFNFSRVSRILELKSLQIKFLESGIKRTTVHYVFDSKTCKVINTLIQKFKNCKVGCVFPMVAVSILPYAACVIRTEWPSGRRTPLYATSIKEHFENAQKYPRTESGWDDLNQRLSWLLILFVDKVFYCSDK